MKQKTPSPHSTFKHTATTVKEMDNMGRETKKLWQKLTAYCCAGLLTFQPLISVADTIAVDKTVSVSQRPTLDRAANGVDIVNIARPNDKGVSHNLFSEFNVSKDGVILNNSRTITNTQLGGHIAGNANLTDASARLILNEVTGANRSQLLGYTEIAGQSADYVLANPYGITCDGCGFINIPRVTLAAGKPEMANGQLRSINVDNGNFIVQGMGLNAANVKHLDIIARSAHINAQLHAQKVMMALGKNRVDYATSRPTALESDGSDSPEFALDVAALGGMYVNAITMMGTESGVGVRVAGDMAAATGDMVLTADGNIVINKATAKERIAISSFNGDVTLQGNVHANIIDAIAGKTLSLTGDIVAGTSEIDLRALDIVTDAQLLTGYDTNGNYLKDGLLLAIAQNSWINSGEVLSTGDANIVVNRLLNKPDALIQADKDLLLRAVTVTNQNAIIAAGGDLTVTASGYFDNSYGALFSGSQNLTGDFGQFNNTAGLFSAGADIHVEIAQELNNASGNISAGGGVLIEGEGTLTNAGGSINSSDASLNLQGIFNNQNGSYIRDDADLVLNLGGLDNRNGYLFHSGTGVFELNITGDFDNRAGQFGSEGSLFVTADNLFNDDGILYGKDRLDLAITNSITNLRGQLSSDTVMAITSNTLNNNAGEIFAADMALTTTGLFNNRAGLLQAESLQLQAQTLDNQQGDIRITGTADSEISITETLDNTEGSIKSNANNTTLTAQSIDNASGVIAHFGDDTLAITTTDTLANQGGQITSSNSVDIIADQIDNQRGDIYTQTLNANATNLNNNGGTLEANQLTLTVDGDLSNRIDSEGNAGQLLATGNQDNSLSLTVTGELDNTGGLIQSAATNNRLTLANLNNTQGHIQHLGTGRFDLFSTAFNNTEGKLIGNGVLALTAGQLTNTSGLISSLDDLIIQAIGTVNNTSGRIESAAGLQMTAEVLTNQQGIVLSSGSDDTTIQTTTLDNNSGTIQTNANTLNINATDIDNTDGKILHAGANALQITADDLTNQTGEIISNANLAINDATINNRAGTLSANTIAIDGTSLDNDDGVIDGETVDITLTGNLLNDGNAYLVAQSTANNSLALTINGLLRNAGTLGTNAASVQIAAQNLTNTGRVVHAGSGVLRLEVQQALVNENRIESNGSLVLRADSLRNQHLLASTGDLDIGVTGLLDNRSGTLDSQGRIEITAANLDNRAGLVLATGTADSDINVTNLLDNTGGTLQTNANNLSITAEELRNNDNGKLLHAGNNTLQITATNLANNSGQVASNNALVVNATDFNNQSGNLGAQTITLTGDQLDNSSGVIDADQLTINVTGDVLNNNNGQLIALGTDNNALLLTVGRLLDNGGYIGTNAQQATINAGNFTNNGQVLHAGFGVLRLDVQQNWLNNGVLESNGNLLATTGTLTNTNLIATSGTLDVTATTITNSNTLDSGAAINLTATNLDNSKGTITAAGTANSRIDITDTLENTDGIIQANANQFTIAADQLNNNGGQILHAGANALDITATSVDNTTGSLVSNNQLVLAAQQTVNRVGNISAATVDISGTDLNNRDGTIDADQLNIQLTGNLDNISDTATASISALGTAEDSLIINVDGTLQNSGTLQTNADSATLTLGNFTNTGRVLHAGFGVLRLDVQSEFINQQRIDSNGSQALFAGNINNTGIITAAGNLDIDFSQALTNSGDLDAAGAFSLAGTTLTNTGYITGAGTTDNVINLSGTLNNNGGVIQTNANNFSITVDQLQNTNAAAIKHAGTGQLDINATEVTNNSASITSNSELVINANVLDNREATIAAQQIQVTGQSVDNSGGTIDADRLRMELSGDLTNNLGATNGLEGLITALGTNADDLWLNVAGNLNNAGVIQTRAESATIAAGQLNNSNAINHVGVGVLRLDVLTDVINSNLLESSGQINLTASNVTNTGVIAAVDTLDINTQNTFNNNQGTLDSSATINLQANSFTNADGYVVSAGTDGITWTVINSLNNTDGIIETNAQNIVFTLGDLTNQNGRITHAGNGTFTINAADEINNENGLLESVATIALDSSVINNAQGDIYADTITLNGGNLDNTDGIIEANTLALQLAQITNQQSSGSERGILSALGSTADSLSINTTGTLTNSGIIQTNALNATINAQSINNTKAITHAGLGVLRIDTSGALTNNAGQIVSLGSLDVQVNSLANSNAAALVAENTLTFNAQTGITNNASQIGATQAININVAAGNLVNSNAANIISNGGNSTVNASGTINNQTGEIALTGSSTVSAGNQIDNRAGTIAHVGDGELTVSATTIENSGGNLVGEDSLLINNFTQLLNNMFSGVVGNINAPHITLDGSTINNTGGTIYASGTNSLEVTADSLTNNNGDMFSEGNVTIDTDTLANTGGSIQSQQILTLNLPSVNLNGGLLNAAGSLVINTQGNLVNGAGNQLITNGDLTLNTNGSITNQGTLSTLGNLGLSGTNLTNQANAVISAGNLLDLNFTGTVTNAGRLSSGQNLNLIAQTLNNNSGAIAAGNNLTATVGGNLNNRSLLFAASNLNLYVAGEVNNYTQANIFALNNITIARNAALASNTQVLNESGTIESYEGNVGIYTNLLENHRAEYTVDDYGNVLTDSGVASILAGGNMTLNANLIRNTISMIAADGDLHMEGGSLVNEAQLYGYDSPLEHYTALGATDVECYDNGYCFMRRTWYENPEDYGDGILYAMIDVNSPNQSGYLPDSYLDFFVGGSYFQTGITVNGPPPEVVLDTWFGVQGDFGDGEIGSNWSRHPHEYDRYADGWDVVPGWSPPYTYHIGYFLPDQIWFDSFTTVASTIQAGGNLTGDFTGTLENVNLHRTYDGGESVTRNAFVLADHSNINNAANNTLQNTNTNASGSNLVTVEQQTVNVGNTVNVNATTQQFGTSTERDINSNTGANTVDRSLNTVEQVNSNTTTAQIDGTRTGVDNVTSQTGGTNVSGGNTTVENATSTNTPVALENNNTDAPPVAIADNNGATPVDTQNPGTDPLDPDAQPVVNPITPPANNGNDTTVPDVISYNPTQNLQLPTNNGMFVVNTTPQSQYLVETNPILTDYLNFIGTDYLLDRLGYDPAELQRRLGDAFYETRLLREGLFNLFGQRYLTDQNTGLAFTSDEAQFKYLMDNAIAANEALELSVGIALSAEQVAQLTHDIVWLVEQDVNGEKVLAPVYYASAARAGDLDNKGALMTGQNVSLSADSGVTNTGRLIGQHDLTLRTQQALQNTGTISADNFVLLEAGSITNTRDKVGNSGNIASGRAGTVQLISRGDINNDSRINGGDLLLKSETGSLTNSGSLSANRDLVAIAQRDIINTVVTEKTGERVGSIESGRDLSLITREGDISNRAAITTDNPYGHTTRVTVGTAPRINAGGDMTLDAGRDVLLTASNLRSGNDMTLHAARDIQVENAANESHFVGKDYKGKVNQSSRVEHVGSSLDAGGDMTMNAGRDVNLLGTDVTAQGNIGLTAERDINLEAVADTFDSEFHRKRHDSIKNTVTHVQTTLAAGGDASMNAGQDINMIGSTLTAQGDASLHAERDTNLVAVNDSEYHYEYEKKKKSFGRSTTTVTETLKENVVGGVIDAGGDVLINARKSGDTLITETSGNVNIVGGVVRAGNDVVIAADDDINVTGATYNELDFYSKSKSGFGGLTGKEAGQVQEDTKLAAAMIAAQGGDATMISGNNLSLVGADVVADGDVNLEAVDQLLINAGEVVSQSESWSKKSGFFSGGDFYSSTERNAGESVTGAQASTVTAGGNVNISAGSAKVIGSDIHGETGVDINTDIGDLEVLAARTTTESYSYEKDMSIGFGDLAEGLSRPDQLVKNEDGRATIKLADATYDEVDTKTQTVDHRGSTVTSGGSVDLASTENILIEGSHIAADVSDAGQGDVTLAAGNNVTIKEATDTYDSDTKEIHGKAELSVVVQHQAVEVAKALIAVDEAKDQLEQAKKDYKKYEKDLDNLQNTLNALEADYANKPPGVSYEDVLELRELVDDVKGDKEWYVAGIALAAVNLTSKTTALVQQTAAAAQSTATYGFNAGVQLDIDASKTTTSIKETTAVASTVSGNNINIQTGVGKGSAEGTSTNIGGSHLQAKDTLAINTGELNITASKNTQEIDSNTEQGHISAQMTAYGAAAGGVSVNADFSRSKNSETHTTINNSTLTANNIQLTTTGDTNIRGGNVHADSTLVADINGDLNVESLQNRSRTKNNSAGISGGFSASGGDVTGVNGGINASNGMSTTRETVRSSLTSGGTADITVAGNTQITAATIATMDEDGNDLGNLNLNTGSLSFTDLRDTHQSNQTSGGISTSLNVGGTTATEASQNQQLATDSQGRELDPNTSNITYSNNSQYDASKALATLGTGNITVGGVQMEKDGELTDAGKADDSPLTALNRDTTNTTKDLWSVERQEGNVDLAIDHRLLSEEGRKEIKNNFVDSYEFGEDIYRASETLSNDQALGLLNFWETLHNNAQATQLKNDLLRNPDNAHILEGLKSGDGDQYAQAMSELGHLAQNKFGLSLSDISLYDAGNTTSTSLQDTILTDVKGGTVIQQGHNEYGNIFIDASDASKTSMVNTLGHEVIETQALQNGGQNNAVQEAQANAFGNQFADRVDQAAGGNLDSTGGSNFNHSLLNSNAVQQGTQRANTVGGAQVEHRQLMTQEMTAIRDMAPVMAEREGITPEEAERRMAEELAGRVDASWNRTQTQAGRDEDAVALDYLAEALVGLGDNYRPDPNTSDVPVLPEDMPPSNYTAEDIKGFLTGYQDNHSDHYNNRTLHGDELDNAFSLQGQFYDQNFRQSMTLDNNIDQLGGEMAGVMDVGAGILDGISYFVQNPIDGSEAMSLGALRMMADLPGYVGEIYDERQQTRTNAILDQYQGDYYNAARQTTASDLSLGLEVLGAMPLPAGRVGALRHLDDVGSPGLTGSEILDLPVYGTPTIKDHILANIAESQAARGASNFNAPKIGLASREWPPYPGTINQVEADFTLLPGTLVDRFGPPRGTFLSPVGTSYSERALKPGTMREDYYVYEVLQPLTVKTGEIRAWFGETGNGTQYRLDPIDNIRRTPQTLTSQPNPILKEVYRGKFSEYEKE